MSLTSTVSPGIGMDINCFLTDFFLFSHNACECMKPVLFLILSFTKRGKKLPQPFHYVFSKILMRQASYNNTKNLKLVSKSGNVIHKLAKVESFWMLVSLSSRQFCACRKDTLLSAAKYSASSLRITHCERLLYRSNRPRFSKHQMTGSPVFSINLTYLRIPTNPNYQMHYSLCLVYPGLRKRNHILWHLELFLGRLPVKVFKTLNGRPILSKNLTNRKNPSNLNYHYY